MHQSSFKTSLFRKKLAKKDRCIQLHYMRQGPAVDYQWWSERHYLKRGLLGDCTHNYWWGIEEHTTIGGLYRTHTETQLLQNWTHRQGARLLLTIEGGDSLLPEGSLPLLYVGETTIVGRGKSHQQDCGVKKNILAVEGAFSEPSARTPAFLST